jgi:hypothetical protein
LPARFVAAALTVLAAVGCSSAKTPTLTGFGASRAVFTAHRGPEYSSIVTDAAGRVQSYILTTPPRTLAQAQAAVKRDLPADATASPPQAVVGIEQTKCEIVEFTSPTLQRVFGGDHGGQVMAVFEAENAIVMDTERIVSATVVSGVENLPRQC